MPRGQTLHVLAETFPGIPLDQLSLHQEIAVHGGSACNSDVISFGHDGQMQIGELLMSVGIAEHGSRAGTLYSIVSKWAFDADGGDHTCVNMRVLDDPIVIKTSIIDSVLVYALSLNKETCLVLLSYELQPPT